MCEVNSIYRSCETAAAGLTRMFMIDVNDVELIPLANTDWIIEDDIILKPYKYFKTINFREQAAGLSEELADAVGGGFKKNLSLKLSRYGSITNKWVYDMVGARFIVLIEDFNGQTIIIGDLINAMRLEKASSDTGKKMGDENGWIISFMAENRKPCHLYEGIIITEDNIPPIKIEHAVLVNGIPNYEDTGNKNVLVYM